MHKHRMIYTLYFFVFFFGIHATVYASTIFVSGDTNITNALDGSEGFSISPGNQQFFTNILQGGTDVVVLETNNGLRTLDNAGGIINTYYNNLSGVTSTILSTQVTPTSLTGVELFVSAMPDDPFTTSEIDALSNFLSAGGNVLFLGDNSSVAVPYNDSINDALLGLGSSITMLNTILDTGINTSTGSQLKSDPFTAGITSFTYAAATQISAGDDGVVLITGSSNKPYIAYQSTAVPLPPSLLLLGSGLFSLIGLSRRS